MKTETNTNYIINETSKPCSYEFGKPASRMKIYYSSPSDLDNQIKELKELGYIDSEGNPIIPSK